jgi:hypothetical protein
MSRHSEAIAAPRLPLCTPMTFFEHKNLLFFVVYGNPPGRYHKTLKVRSNPSATPVAASISGTDAGFP